jgi:heme A synthase
MSRRFQLFSLLALLATLAVILWGAYVRTSGSGAGCGSHWPTCNGEIVPLGKSTKTLIEYTHRLTSGLSLLLVLGQCVWAFAKAPKNHPVRLGAGLSMFFMLTEAGVGAGLVLLELVAENKSIARALWMSMHLTNTFLLVASLTLTVWWSTGRAAVSFRGNGALAAAGIAALVGTLVLGISGAITALGDTLFPSTSLAQGMQQDFSPAAHFLIRLRVLHPVIGVGVAGYVLFASGLFSSRVPNRDVRRLAMVAGTMFVVQVCLGFVNLALLAPTALQILHLLTADLVWISVVLLCGATLAEGQPQTLHATPPATLA